MYLATNTRPDIAYSVNQCARFTHSPKASHAAEIMPLDSWNILTEFHDFEIHLYGGVFFKKSSEIAYFCDSKISVFNNFPICPRPLDSSTFSYANLAPH